MKESIFTSFMNVTSAKQLWEEINERFAESNGPLLFQLRRELATLVQGTDSLIDYFGKMKKIWDDIANIEEFVGCTCNKCTCGVNKRILARDNSAKLQQFLMGLIDAHETIRSNILVMEPEPTVNKAYHLVQQSHRQKNVTFVYKEIPESSALNASSVGGSQGFSFSMGKYLDKKDAAKRAKMTKVCSHCNQRGHTVEQCFKIHGFLDWFKDLKSKQNSSGSSTGSFRSQANLAELHDNPLASDSGGKRDLSGKIDSDFMAAFCQEMMKVIRTKSLAEFSGP